ncbi:MAG: recombinase family protein, partial [Lachnospiraceae bacterium]|nr:recombinase family protein [Lachnospiraceae bacterium]
MMEIFQKYRVEFVSTTEKFDTSTPIGRAMLNICIVFAQLERETIQKRVTDAYYARSKRGFYMGGRVPYGYCLKKTIIDHVHTSMYEEIPEESGQLKLIYAMYADPSNSLGDIVRFLKENQIENLRGGVWSSARISEMLRNPVYVKADIDVYRFFKEQGAKIMNPASDFTGYNGCYLYKGTVSDVRKQCELKDKEIVLAPHKGLISSKEWLACRKRCLNNRCSTKTCKAKNSWLCGKVKCGNCGYALTICKSKTKWERYFVCSKSGILCKGTGCTIYADVLEEYAAQIIKEKLSEFHTLSQRNDIKDDRDAREERCLAEIEEEISSLLLRVADANDILMKYINDRIGELEKRRKRLEDELALREEARKVHYASDIEVPERMWEKLSFEDKQSVADVLIEVIRIAEGRAEIFWRV